MSYQAVIFDLDGVLINIQPHISAIDEVIINRGFQDFCRQPARTFVQPGQLVYEDLHLFDSSLGKKFREMATLNRLDEPSEAFISTYRDLRERIIDELSEHGAAMMGAFKGAHYEVARRVLIALRNYAMMNGDRLKIDVHPGVVETLDHLRENGIKIAVASSNTLPRVRGRLVDANLTQFGDCISGANGTSILHKPEPDVFFDAAGKIGVSPRFCVGVDDSADGIQAAKMADMYAIGLVQNPWERIEVAASDLRRSGADLICKDFGEVRKELDSIFGFVQRRGPASADSVPLHLRPR